MSVPNVNFFINYVNDIRGKGLEKCDKKYIDERKFYSCGQYHDYIEYINNGSKEKLDFVAYSGNNEKSHGLFNEKGMMNRADVKEIRQMLRKTKSVIWHGVISFTEYFGNRYCDTTEKAMSLMKTEFPKFFKNAGLNPDNIVWFAGLHENTDNKHIHFSFFERSPQRYKQKRKSLCFSDGRIPLEAINTAKVDIEKKLSELTSNLIYGRKTLTEEMKKQLELGVFMKKLNSLVIVLPMKGRMSYSSENIKQYQPQINQVINSIIRTNKDLHQKFKTYVDILSKRDIEILKAYNRINVDCSDKLLKDKCLDDLYRRLGNLVLNSVVSIRREQKKVEYETKNRLILKHIEKKKKRILLKKCLQLNELVNREMISAFEEYREKLAEANYSRLREEGYMD